MPIPVPGQPSTDLLERYQVGEPASSMHFRSMIQTINHLRAYVVQPYIGTSYQVPPSQFVSPATVKYPVLFIPTTGVLVARIQCTTHAYTQGNRWNFSAVTIDGAAATLITGSDAVFDGDDTNISSPNERQRKSHIGYVSLSGLSTTAVHTLLLEFSNTDDTNGLAALSVHEVPYAMVDPAGNPSTEPGVNEAWPDARNRLYEGSGSNGAGTQRLINELLRVRAKSRHHWWIATPEDDTLTIKKTGAGTGQLNYQGAFDTSRDPYFFMVPKRLTSSGNTYKLHVRYKWGGVAGAAFVRVSVDTSEDEYANTLTLVSAVLTLANTGGAYTVGSTATFQIPVDGPGHRVRIRFDGDADGSDLHITNLSLIEEET